MAYWGKLGISVAGAAGLIAAGVWGWRWVRRRRQKSPAEIERLRRLNVNACGRIVPGRIADLLECLPDGSPGPILLYKYEVAGVNYEAAQDLSTLPEVAAAAPFLAGQNASIKYDPKQPTNSILACEVWCGIPDLPAPARPETPTGDQPEPPPPKPHSP